MFCTCTALEMRDTARKPSFVPDKKDARTEARDEVMQNPPTLDPEVTESLQYMITQSRNRTNVGAESTASRWLWECARESSVCSNTRLVESWRRRRWLCKERSMICVPTCTWVYSIRCTHALACSRRTAEPTRTQVWSSKLPAWSSRSPLCKWTYMNNTKSFFGC